MRSTTVLFRVSVVLLMTSAAANSADALRLFKNYFVTGDYVVGGTGMRGTGRPDPATQAIVGGTTQSYARGTIRVSGVPANADVVAAFLYWQSLESSAEPSSAV